MGSPSTVITMGFGNWGSVNLLPTLGFGIGEGPSAGGLVCGTVTHAPRVDGIVRLTVRVAGLVELEKC